MAMQPMLSGVLYSPSSMTQSNSEYQKLRGRPISDVWKNFDDEFAMRLKNGICKHCKKMVGYHRKVASARNHLARKCPEFGAYMRSIPVDERPEWFNEAMAAKRVKSELRISKEKRPMIRQSSALPYSLVTMSEPKFRERELGRESNFPMISVDDALAIVLHETETLAPVNMLLNDIPLGATLAVDVVASEPMPPFRASIMDGYAIISSDTSEGGVVLEVVGRITAGVDSNSMVIQHGQCAYITTGAMLPEGADAVIRVEDTRGTSGDPLISNPDENSVEICKKVPVGNSIRPIGSDIKMGEIILAAGMTINSAEIGLLATCGITNVSVVSVPRVGVLSSGDELVEPGEAISGGKIRDSNRATLLSFVRSSGAEAIDLGIVSDVFGGIEKALHDAVQRCDVIITSGGVSMGEADLLKPILERMGTIHFGRIHMKPGKPTTFATVEANGRNVLIFALPGNPVSCLVTGHIFVTPALKKLSGKSLQECVHSQLDVTLSESLKLDPERPEYHRAVVSWEGPNRGLTAVTTGSQMSCRLLSMRGANALLCLPAQSGYAMKGSKVRALLIGQICAPLDPNVSVHPFAAGGLRNGQFEVYPYNAGMTVEVQHDHGHHHDHVHYDGVHHEHSDVRTHIRVALLTISDRAHEGVYEDLSGPAMEAFLLADGLPFDATVLCKKIVPDETADIQAFIKEYSRDGVDLILTSGGTGFGRRDRTPEAIKPLLEREASGIVLALYQMGLKHTPLAVLSRPVAGTRGNTLIITLPGSVKAIKENMVALVPLLSRITNLLQGNAC